MFKKSETEVLKERLVEMERYKEICEGRHDRTEDQHKRLEDKILIQAQDINQIRQNTDTLIQGDLLKKAMRQTFMDFSKYAGGLIVIGSLVFSSFDMLAKALKIYLGM